MRKSEYIIQSELIRDRGWSKKMIDTHLVSHDKTAVNHINSYYPELKYYLMNRVRRIERTEEFRVYMMNKRKRRISRIKGN